MGLNKFTSRRTKTMTKPQMFDANGNPIEGQILPDGGRVVVPRTIMDAAPPKAPAALAVTDGAQHRPGPVAVTDEERARRAASVKDASAKLSDRWKNPPALATDATKAATPHQPVAAKDRDAMYAAADRRLEQRWRSAGGAA
jgi:hypothetical protein